MKHLNELTPFLLDHERDLFERFGAAVGDREMERVVDRRFAGGLFRPTSRGALASESPFCVQREIDDRRRPAERSRNRAAGEVVGGHGAAERHVEVRVRIDEARENVRSRRVDDRRARRPVCEPAMAAIVPFSIRMSAAKLSVAVTIVPPLTMVPIVVLSMCARSHRRRRAPS